MENKESTRKMFVENVGTVPFKIIFDGQELVKDCDKVMRLIENAPETLEILKRMVRAFNVKEIDPLIAFAMIEQARAIIEKTEERI